MTIHCSRQFSLASRLNSANLFPLADIAHFVRRNAAHVTTVVRRKTGLTVGEWIAERRMAHARMLLQNGQGQKIDDLSFECGYDDPSHFLRLFKRIHGATPAQWRANFYADFTKG